MEKNKYKLQDLEKLVSLAKRRGIIFPSSEIYGGLASVWDYGPIGVEIKRNVLVNPLKASIFAHSYDELRQGDKEIKQNNFCCFSCKAL